MLGVNSVRSVLTGLVLSLGLISSSPTPTVVAAGPCDVSGACSVGLTTPALTTTGSGLTIGSSGTAITGSFRSTSVRDIGNLVANTCETWQFAVTGAVAGGECVVGVPSSLDPRIALVCHADTDVVEIHACNVSAVAVNPASATFSARVFNP